MNTKKILTILALSLILSSMTYAHEKGHQTENHSQSDSLVSHLVSHRPLVSFPLKHIHISSPYGMRLHPIYKRRMMHHGIDLKACYEVVYAMLPGRVMTVGYDRRSGHYITIQTGAYAISYCHLSRCFVREGAFVEAGTPIAVSGNSGASTGPHLHLAIKVNRNPINPQWLLNLLR